jgi:hypothetical protein
MSRTTSSNKLPFIVGYENVGHTLDGDFQVVLFSSSNQDSVFNSANEVFQLFSSIAARNMFARGSLSGDFTSASDEDRSKLVIRASAQQFRVEYFAVFLALLAQNVYSGDSIDKLVLMGNKSILPDQNATLMVDPFIVFERAAHLPFAVDGFEDSDAFFSGKLFVRLSFEQQIPVEVASEVVDGLEEWGLLVELGGSMLSFGEQDDFGITSQRPSQVEKNIIEHELDFFGGEAQSLHLLLNYCVRVHKLGNRLTNVEFEFG